MKILLLILALSSALTIGTRFVAAQSMGLPLKVPVTFQAEIELDSYYWNDCDPYGYYLYYGVSLADAYSELDQCYAGSGWNYFPETTANLRPGKKYTFYFDADEYALGYRVRFAPIEGYRLIIDDVETYKLEGDADWGSIYESFTVYLEAVEEGTPFGAAESIQGGSKIFWQVGMGSALNGSSLGHVQIRQSDFSSSLFTPAVLDYESASEDVEIYRSGANLSSVKTPQGLMVVGIANSYTYELKFYDESQVSGSAGSYSTSGSPFVKYAVTKYQGSSTKLQISKYVVKNDASTSTESWSTRLEKSGSTWTLYDWTRYGTTCERVKKWVVDSSGLGQTIEVRPSLYGSIVSREREVYSSYSWGTELYYETMGYGYSDCNLTTTYDYHSTSGIKGKLKSMTRPDGSWISYGYYTDVARRGLPKYIYEPYMDSPTTAASATSSNSKYTYYTYENAWDGSQILPNTVTTKVNGTVTARTNFDYVFNESVSVWGASLPLIVVERTDESFNGVSPSPTVTKSFRSDAYTASFGRYFPGLVHSVTNPDGTRASRAYMRGTPNLSDKTFSYSSSGAGIVEHVYTGSSTNVSGSSLLSSVGTSGTSSYYDVENVYLVPGVSSRNDTVKNGKGEVCWTASYTWTGSTWQLIGGTAQEYDRLGNVTKTESFHYDGDSTPTHVETYSATYDYGRLVSEIDETGVETQFHDFDFAGRATRQVTLSYDTTRVPQVTSYYEYDAEGRVKATKVGDSNLGTANQIVSKSEYDMAGRIKKEEAPGNVNGAATVGVIPVDYSYQNGGRTVTRTYPDGGYSTQNFYRDGRLKSVTGTAAIPQYVKYQINTDGSETETTALNSSYTGGWSMKTVDWLGRPFTEETPTYDGETAKLWYGYDSSTGQLKSKTLKDNANNVLLMATTLYEYDSMGMLVREGLDLDGNGSLSTGGYDRITDYSTEVVATGSIRWLNTTKKIYPTAGSGSSIELSSQYKRLTHLTGSLRSEEISYDPHGNYVQTLGTVDRTARKSISTTYHSSATNTDLAEAIAGQPVFARSKEGVETTYEYDEYGRRDLVKGRDQIWTATEYYPGTAQVKRTWDAIGDTGSWTYDASGRVATASTVDDASVVRTTRYSYDKRGQAIQQWGNGTMPVEVGYNGYGWKTSLKTYRGGSGWDGVGWPVSPGSADTTTWNYQNRTGLLLSKLDAAGHGSRYKYNDRGQISGRTNARDFDLTQSGNLTLADSQVPWSVSYTYFEANDSDNVSKGTGTLKKADYSDSTPDVSYTYHRHGSINTVTDATGTRTFTYRSSDLQLDQEKLAWGFYGGSSSGDVATLSRKYDTTTGKVGRSLGLRFGHQTNLGEHIDQTYTYDSGTGRLSTVYAHSTVFTYSYQNKSNRVSQVTNGPYTRNTVWQTNRSAIDYVETKWVSSTKAKYDYSTDLLGRINAVKFQGSLATNSSTSADAGFGYQYGVQTDFQYSNRDELEYADTYLLDSSGSVPDPNPTAVAGMNEAYSYDNARNRLSHIHGALAQFNYEPNQLNQYTEASDGISPAFDVTYDEDGNKLWDGRWDYSYDAENRLVNASNHWSGESVEYTYDYLGRMVSRKSKTMVGGMRGRYFGSIDWGDFEGDRTDSTINFSWSGSPGVTGVPSDGFIAQWSGYLEAPKSGTYRIYLESDDGAAMYFDGRYIPEASDWNENGYSKKYFDVHLKGGVRTPFIVNYRDNSGASVIRLKWSGGPDNLAEAVIPQSNLWSESKTTVEETRYVYDGWNIVAELDASKIQGSTNFASCAKQTHVWGLDVSGAGQAAGGIGGLLLTREGGSNYFPVFDGRGNITGMLNTSGQVVAGYQYNAFGEIAAAVGSKKDDFHFGWSTKFTEDEMKLINFGKRWYDTRHGRFINRDPIGEQGGINLYAFLNNNPLGGYELLGMGFLSKLWKKIKRGFKKVANFVLKPFEAAAKRIKKAWRAIKPYVGTILNVAFSIMGMPMVGAALSSAWAASQGASFKEILRGFGTSLVGGYFAGPISGGISRALGFEARHLATALLRGSTAGGISGGLNSKMNHQSFWEGFKRGALTGAATSGLIWAGRLYRTNSFIKKNVDLDMLSAEDNQTVLNAIHDAGQSPIGQRLFKNFSKSGSTLSIRDISLAPPSMHEGGTHVFPGTNDMYINVSEFRGGEFTPGTIFTHEMGHLASGYNIGSETVNTQLTENRYRWWMGIKRRSIYVNAEQETVMVPDDEYGMALEIRGIDLPVPRQSVWGQLLHPGFSFAP